MANWILYNFLHEAVKYSQSSSSSPSSLATAPKLPPTLKTDIKVAIKKRYLTSSIIFRTGSTCSSQSSPSLRFTNPVPLTGRNSQRTWCLKTIAGGRHMDPNYYKSAQALRIFIITPVQIIPRSRYQVPRVMAILTRWLISFPVGISRRGYSSDHVSVQLILPLLIISWRNPVTGIMTRPRKQNWLWVSLILENKTRNLTGLTHAATITRYYYYTREDSRRPQTTCDVCIMCNRICCRYLVRPYGSLLFIIFSTS